MSGLDKILSKILAEAQASGELKIAEAKEKADSVLLESATLAKAVAKKRVSQSKKEAQWIIARGESAAVLQSKRLLLQERNRIIDQVLIDVKTQIIALPDVDYFSMLERFVRSHAQKGPGTLVLCKSDLSRLPRDFDASLSSSLSAPVTVSGTPGSFDAGCVLIYGEVEYNGTVDALIIEKRDELRDLLNKELFAE